jgi:enoyl-CoA hydratase/carnithine racemase
MHDSPVRIAVQDGIATILMDRPERRNALSAALLDALLAALEAIRARHDVRVLVLRGAGSAFCGGMDLREMLAVRDEQGWFDYDRLPRVFEHLADYPNPTIAVVQGSAFAGGCELALHCDIRIGSPLARFAMPLARLGLVAPAYAIQRLVLTTGAAVARDMLLTGDVIEGRRALDLGLLTRLEPEDTLAQRADEVARRIAESAPLSLRAMKAAIARVTARLDGSVVAELDAARLQVSRSEDMREGLSAFLERRTPQFAGV